MVSRRAVVFGPIIASAFASFGWAKDVRILQTGLASDIKGLTPGITSDLYTGAVLQHIYEGLVAWKADGTVAPMLAEKIDVSDDGLTYTFTLRDGVKFHNGAPLTSAEVVWTWKYFLDPAHAWTGRVNFSGDQVIKIVSVTAPDAKTVVFKLDKPQAAFLSMIARADLDSCGIAHPDCVDANGAWSKAIGTGPFVLKEWRKGQSIELARFADYSPRSEASDGLVGKKQPLVDGVLFNFLPDEASGKLALQSKNLDVWSNFSPNYAKELKSASDITLESKEVAAIAALLIQNSDPLLKDLRMRQAIAASIDYDTLTASLSAGFGTPNTSLVPTSSHYYRDVQKQGHKLDLDKARSLLAKAGYKGQPVKIKTISSVQTQLDAGVLLQGMLTAAGINAAVDVVDLANLVQAQTSGNYQMMITFSTPYLDPIFFFDRYIGDKAVSKDKVWATQKARDLLAALYAAGDDASRQKAFDDLHREMIADVPLVVWMNRISFGAWHSDVKGYEPWAGDKPRFWNVAFTA